MPFDPESFDFSRYPEYQRMFDDAIKATKGIFVPCSDRPTARSLVLSLGRWRSAYLAQTNAYTYADMRVEMSKKDDPKIGVYIRKPSAVPHYTTIPIE